MGLGGKGEATANLSPGCHIAASSLEPDSCGKLPRGSVCDGISSYKDHLPGHGGDTTGLVTPTCVPGENLLCTYNHALFYTYTVQTGG